jgi:RND family efflux transporter MFP subunit
MQYLGSIAERALKERRGFASGADGGAAPLAGAPAFVGYPIEVGGALQGAVALHLAPSREPDLQSALRLLHWSSAWLADGYRQQWLQVQERRAARLSLASDLVATALQERLLHPTALAVANELALRLDCDRVSVGLDKGGGIELNAISHTASFDPRTDLARLVGEAMEEVLDLQIALVFPASDTDAIGAIAHAELAAECRDIGVCSVPLADDGHTIGALTLQRTRGQPFDAEEVELCKTVGMLLGPILALKRQNERGPWRRATEATAAAVRVLFGPSHPGAKLGAAVALVLVVFFSIANGDYRVSAKTVIEGAVQRAVAAPFEGFVAASGARAGDTVKKGQVLAQLDPKDLNLERVRWTSEREQSQRKYWQAAALQDRAMMAVTAAQVEQTQAQLSLVEEKLQRAALTAPFDGVVVAGDLSHLVGSPVEHGKVLFEIAPLDAYRVIVNVDERDIAELQIGQRGELALSGLPYEKIPFSVKQITPVSTTQDGRNFFRVEADVGKVSERLRPGMEGVGKVLVGERKLIWIWTHGLVDWVRLWTWRWLP